MIHALVLAIATTASPQPRPLPTPDLGSRAMHAVINVEVNARGQVVTVTGGELSRNAVFDTMVIGNALQMWIRHPDGSADVGTFRVTYDYDPRTHNIRRTFALISRGGAWAHSPGAATKMIELAQRETRDAYHRMLEQQKKRDAQAASHLPDINAAVKRAMSSPKPSPQPQ
jgi:hypothetical protein